MNTDSLSLYQDDPDALLEEFKKSIKNNFVEDDLQYVLKPVTGKGKISINKLGATETTPRLRAELFFEEFGIDLDSQQYKDILWTLSKFHWYLKTHRFRKFRPKVLVSEDPNQWFRYAANSVLNEIHEKNYKWSWEYFAKRRDQRKQYIKLYKAKLLNKLTDQTDVKNLDDLEMELTFEDIKFYRSMTRNELRKENAMNEVKKAQEGTTSQQQQGWFSGWWSGGGTGANDSDSKEPEHLDQQDLQLSDDQRKALYEAIDYNENDISNAIDLPREAVEMEILATLEKGGISIRPSKGSDNLAEVVFEGCKTQFYQRPDSFLQISSFKNLELKMVRIALFISILLA